MLLVIMAFMMAISGMSVYNPQIVTLEGEVIGIMDIRKDLGDQYENETMKYMFIIAEFDTHFVADYEIEFEVGDRVRVTFDTVGTFNPYDDEIMLVEKI